MEQDRPIRERSHARDAALRRLRLLTRALVVGAAALAAVLTALAAHATGRKAPGARATTTPRARPVGRTAVPAVPSLPDLGSGAVAAPAPAPPQPPAQAPAATPAPPVAASGSS